MKESPVHREMPKTQTHTHCDTNMDAQVHTQTSRPGRVWERAIVERVRCYLFISLSCSREATSPRSCKHTETQASVSSNPGNNKWSPHRYMRDVGCQHKHTHTLAGCQHHGSKDKTTSYPELKEDKSRLQYQTGFQLSNPTRRV